MDGVNDVPDPARITEDLRSGEPSRVAAGLAALDHAERFRRFVPVPPPAVEVLAPFGVDAPEQVVLDFIHVWQHYPLFDPAPDPVEIRHTVVEAALRHGGEQPVFQVALGLRVDDHPPGAVRDVMRYVHDRELDPTERVRAQQLISHLLDGDTTREAAVEGLAFMALLDRHTELVDALVPQLEPAERARVDEARAE